LRLTAAFGHGFGEVRENDREPQPQRDRDVETALSVAVQEIPHGEDCRDERPNFDDEHDRFAQLPARVELLERLDDRRSDDLPIEQRALTRNH